MQQCLVLGPSGYGPFDDRCQLGLVDERCGVGVGQQVAELRLGVTPVDVDRDGTQLEARQHGFDVLGAVVELQTHVFPDADAERVQTVREPCRPLVELAVGEAPVPTDERVALGNGVGDALEQVGDVEANYRSSLPCMA